MRHAHLRSALVALALSLSGFSAWANGTLTHLSGPVSILKADGKTVPGVQGVKVNAGDTVITGAGGFVRMETTDGGEMVMRPDSQLKIEAYNFSVAQPAEDSFVFSMLKGGMRTISGLISKRGNKDAYKLTTKTATIGIRGTQYDLRVCEANCGALNDGTYVAVRFGAVQASNTQGTLNVVAGQVAFVPLQLPPVILPRDPGIGFTPPAVIPKLDERKKQQSSTGAADLQQSTPAASSSGQPSPFSTLTSDPADGASCSIQ